MQNDLPTLPESLDTQPLLHSFAVGAQYLTPSNSCAYHNSQTPRLPKDLMSSLPNPCVVTIMYSVSINLDLRRSLRLFGAEKAGHRLLVNSINTHLSICGIRHLLLL